MSIAAEVVDQAVNVAGRHGAARIEGIDVRVGALRLVVPEALQLAFTAASQETLAEGAELRITEEAAAAVCNVCEWRFEPDIDRSFVCPRCGQADVRMVAGNDIILQTVVCQTNDEVVGP